jgi:hypothetical protein
MRFHKDRENRLHPLPPSSISAPPPRNAKFVMRSPGMLAQYPIERASPRSRSLSLGEEIGDESPMIAAYYEAYLSMEKMLSAFAELRGDAAESAPEAAHASFHNSQTRLQSH